MNKFIIVFIILKLVLLGTHFFATKSVYAQEYKNIYSQAEIIEVIQTSEVELNSVKNYKQDLKIKILNGEEKGHELKIEHGGLMKLNREQLLKKGDVVIVVKFLTPVNNSSYSVIDKYRLNQLLILFLVFIFIAFLVLGKKGIGAILGLIFSLFVIVTFIVPQIISGHNPLLICLIGSFIILFFSIYLAHGFNFKTTIAFTSTLLTLVLTALLSIFYVKFSYLSGLGSESSYSIQLGGVSNIDLKGLLLGGIIIGTLGVLDDITTTQTATIYELFKLNPKLKFGELYAKSLIIGKEHISALVNTLFLAYTGASLSLFIIFVINQQNIPLWMVINSETVSEEIIRTLIGSIGLILAIPITTFITTWYLTRYKNLSLRNKFPSS